MQASFLFTQLRPLVDFLGPVIFLEEDYYVTEDLVYMALKLTSFRASYEFVEPH